MLKVYLYDNKTAELEPERHFFLSLLDKNGKASFKGYQSLKGVNSILSAIQSKNDSVYDIKEQWEKGMQKYDCSSLDNLIKDFQNSTGIEICLCQTMGERDTCKGLFKGY